MPRIAPEVLAPAGDRECLHAAIENGADAVYFGLQHGFNARFRAGNFTMDELPEVMDLLHRRGLKGYLTLNTLAFPQELSMVEETLRVASQANVDAVLVQDLGVARLARDATPDLPLHASTQMTLTCAAAIEAVRGLGIQRAVLPREASLADMRRIREETDLQLEAFVHGALCVAYSGQCLTSESLGGRSANRGQCAQACRLPYQLVCDGKTLDLGAQKYLLSPQDLAVWDLVPQLIDIGICSLKIEGRLKTAEYVAAVASHYRRAVDAAMQSRSPDFNEDDIHAVEQTFSRGLSHGWTAGCDHKMLVPGLTSAKRGVFVGSITEVRRQSVLVKLAAPLAAGDGVVFEGDRAAKEEQGGRVFAMFANGKRLEQPTRSGIVEIKFMPGAVDTSKLFPRQHLWKTDDPQLTKRLRATFTGKPRRKLPVSLQIYAAVGLPLRIVAALSEGQQVELVSEEPLVAAERHPLTVERLREQFDRLGQTQFMLGELAADIEGTPMVPLSVLGRLRHQLIEQLDASLIEKPVRSVTDPDALARLRVQDRSPSPLFQSDAPEQSPQLWVLCRELKQIEPVLATNPSGIYVDLHDIREYRRVAEIMRGSQIPWYLATLRVQLPSETGLLKVLARHAPSGFLIRHLAALSYYRASGLPLVADFSLNAANDLTVRWLLQSGATRVTASYDLNREQLLDLVTAAPGDRLEVVVHQHMPMFHMQHCVFCSVLSPGTNKTNCGRPCDRHQVQLVDRIGKAHELQADVGCRNTVFNGTPQSGAEAIPALTTAGVRNYRLELLHAQPSEIEQLVNLYRGLIAGERSPREVWTALKASNRVGVTRGTLEDRPEFV